MKSAELLQMVWFTASQTPLKAAEVYRALLEVEPDGSQINRNVNPADPILNTANGLLDGIAVELQIRPGRADLLLRPAEAGAGGPEIPTIGIEASIAALRNYAGNIHKAVESTTRISLISRLLEKTESAAAATQRVLESVQVEIRAPNISDSLFQINSRVPLANGLEVNRIMRFEAAAIQTYAVNLNQLAQSLFPVIQEQNYMVMQLDINTVPLTGVMTQDQINSAFEFISEETLRLALAASPQGLQE